MFSYHGKIAGIVRSGAGYRYLILTPHDDGLEIAQFGEFDAAAPDEAWQDMAGCRCIYGLSKGEYARRRLNLIDEAMLKDPDQFLWELSRTCAESMDHYLYSLLQTHGSDSGIEVTCLTVNKLTYEEVGQSFDRRGLLLDRLVFVPEAIRQTLKSRLQSERDLLLVAADDGIHLQLFHRGRLAAFETIEISADDRRIERLCEEIGIVMMSIFGGRTLRRQVNAHLIGNEMLDDAAAVLQAQLPYDFTFHYDDGAALKVSSPQDPQILRRYFSPLAPAYAYYLKEVCALSPVKNAVSS